MPVPGDIQAAVAAKIESAEIHADPFPHLVVPELLPEQFFRRLADSIPPLETFEQSQRGIKADLPLGEENPYFAQAPEEFRQTWRQLRDEVIGATIAPILVRRLEREIEEKYADLFSPELAESIMAGGLAGSDGRIMSRKPGYHLKPHTDSAHFAVTCLVYFTPGEDESSGALCLFRPERMPELRDVSTYYPERAEGIEAELVKEVPIRENLFVAFLNGRASLHGVRIEPGKDTAASRLTYQAHVLPVSDIRKDAETFAAGLADPAARSRWERYAEGRRARAEEKARSAQV
jgi:hypothetical protein